MARIINNSHIENELDRIEAELLKKGKIGHAAQISRTDEPFAYLIALYESTKALLE